MTKIIKRNGNTEAYSSEKMAHFLDWCTCHTNLQPSYIQHLIEKSLDNMDEVHVDDVLNLVSRVAEQMTSRIQPGWVMVAGRVEAVQDIKRLREAGLDLIDGEADVINDAVKKMHYYLPADCDYDFSRLIDIDFDYSLPINNVRMIREKYGRKIVADLNECPSLSLLRQAIDISQRKRGEYDFGFMEQVYDALKRGYFTNATPLQIHAGKQYRSTGSCTLMTIDDSTQGIQDGATEIAKHSKFGSGIGIDVSQIAGSGRPILSTEGHSNGVVPFIRVYDSVLRAWNQGSKRSGAGVITFPWWHIDFKELIFLKANKGLDEQRIRGLKYAMTTDDYLYDMCEKDGEVALVCPNEALKYFGDDRLTSTTGKPYIDTLKSIKEGVIDGSLPGEIIKAREVMKLYLKNAFDSGNVYETNLSNANKQNMARQPVLSSNLCVAGETKILTKRWGNTPIGRLAGQFIECWNGVEWSKTEIVRTSNSERLYLVTIEGGGLVRATAYHRWIVVKDGEEKIVETKYLKEGDVLKKTKLVPCSHGNSSPSFPRQEGSRNAENLHKGRVAYPSNYYTLEYRAKWLGGMLEKIGQITQSGGNRISINVISKNKIGIEGLRMFVMELGMYSFVKHSKVNSEYRVLTIAGSQLMKAYAYGMRIHNKGFKTHVYARESVPKMKVHSVVDTGRSEPTFCGLEPKENKLVFNGQITMNCQEVYIPSKRTKEETLTGLCFLNSTDIAAYWKLSDAERAALAYMQVKALDNQIETDYYSVPETSEQYAKDARYIGVGISNLATLFAEQGIDMRTQEALEFMDEVMDDWSYNIISASNRLAKQRGRCEGYKESKWRQRATPLRMSNVEAKVLTEYQPNQRKWEGLVRQIKLHGMRNTLVMACAPTACQKLTNMMQTPEGIKSLYDLVKKAGLDLKQELPKGWYDLPKPTKVLSRFGEETVERVWVNGKQPTKTLTFEDGNEYTYTLNHKLLVKCDTEGYKWKEVGSLEVGDDVLNPNEYQVLEEGGGNYAITRRGEVINLKTGYVLSQHDRNNGYKYVHLPKEDSGRGAKHNVHRLVAKTYIPNKAPHILNQVNHIDGNKANNLADNLEWSNASLNQKHAVKAGLTGDPVARGKKNPSYANCLLTMEDAENIRKTARVRSFGNSTELGKKYNVDSAAIVYWGIKSEDEINKSTKKGLPIQTRLDIKREYVPADKGNITELAKQYNVSTSVIHNILKGKTYANR